MRRATAVIGWRAGLTALALVASSAVLAADAPTKPARPVAAQLKDEELDEVLVEGRRTREKPRFPSWDDYQQPFDFLPRLVGKFVVEGTVDLHAQGNSEDLRAASGSAECLGFGSAPGVLCDLQAGWPGTKGPDGTEIPGGISTLDPAVLLFGFDPATPGISFAVVDNRGVADTAIGEMTTPDTMLSRSKCVAVAENCERIARITAEPDLKTVRMNVDLLIDQQKAVSFALVLRRVPGTASVVYGRKQEKEKKK